MSIQAASTIPSQTLMAAQALRQQNLAPPAQPQDPPQEQKEEITISQAASALTGAVAGAAIETVGNTASSLLNLPKATYHAAKAIWKTPKIGPVLKTSLSVLLPVAVVATPVLTALGSFGYGLFHGFGEGMKDGVGDAIKECAKDVKYFHKDIASKAVDTLQEIETLELPEGQKPYDIKVIEAGKGLVAATAGAVIDGAGVGLITLARTPRAVFEIYKHLITEDDMGPVLKTTAGILIPPAAVLAAPLGLVGGVVYGVYKGFGDAYKNGIIESVGNRFDDVSKWNKLTKDALDHL